jgi:acetyl-CoA carboxylase biotin carboxyl carrier protein
MSWDLETVAKWAALANEKKLAELTLTEGDKTLIIKTALSASVVLAPAAAGTVTTQQETTSTSAATTQESTSASTSVASSASSSSLKANEVLITSPMVGTFYAAASPESPDFVSVGDRISVGQTLCILEAMKQMNELEAEQSGVLVAVLVANGDPIEFGQPLFKLQV